MLRQELGDGGSVIGTRLDDDSFLSVLCWSESFSFTAAILSVPQINRNQTYILMKAALVCLLISTNRQVKTLLK